MTAVWESSASNVTAVEVTTLNQAFVSRTAKIQGKVSPSAIPVDRNLAGEVLTQQNDDDWEVSEIE